jgi:amino acid adenylation domain-containing protein
MSPVLPSSTLPLAVAATAERFPGKPAFRFGEADLRYGELVERSNQLANALRADGVRRGDLVGILMGKAVENAVAVFGIMAAGAAYVPLDPAAPVARLEQIARSCELSHFVIDAERAGRMTKLAKSLDRRCHVYGVTELDSPSVVAAGWDDVATYPVAAPDSSVAEDDLAYIIFTSGSTGTPKGIMHTHRSGGAYAAMAANLYGVDPYDRLSNFPPLHFDQSTFDFFSGTMVGATTVMIGKEHQLVPASLSKLIEDEKLTIWYSVPRALVQLLLYGALEERDCSNLRWVVYGGEPFPLKHLEALMARWPNARFSNCYGPAETNQCTFHHIGPGGLSSDSKVASADGEAGIPIGVACPGMHTMILDPDDSPVADGDIGELVVNSPTTMKGYWGREDLDDKIFYQHSSDVGSRRYYRTGDLARVNQDGLMEFLGRRDRQIKIRGFRVELDEVESVMLTHEDVSEVAVLAAASPGAEDDKNSDDGPTITAFVATGPEVTVDPAKLQRHCATRLPRYAVPGRVQFVDDFPRTTSGKIDYLALAKQEDLA